MAHPDLQPKDRINIIEAINNIIIPDGGGGDAYTLPPATADTLGGVKVGEGLEVTEDGTLSATPGEQYTLPAATATTLGGVKVGANLTVEADGTLNAIGGGGGSVTYTAGDGIIISGTTISADYATDADFLAYIGY